MSGLDKIENLRQILAELREIAAKLDGNLSNLRQIIDEEKFISDELNEAIQKQLQQIRINQETFMEEYKTLEIGSVPEGIKEADNILEERQNHVKNKQRYLDAVQFFLRLHSSNQEIEELLNQKKQDLSIADMEGLKEEELKEKAECYLWVAEAYKETDVRKKFSFMYKIAAHFEEAICEALQFGELFYTEETVSEKSSVEAVLSSKEQKVDERISVKEEKREEEVPNEEEKIAREEEEEKTDPWEELGIENPELLIVKENPALLKTEISAKANSKFGVKEFQSEMAKHDGLEKIACLKEAYDGCGYTIESIALWRERDFFHDSSVSEKEYQAATQKLMQQGYLKKYIVEGYGEFYCLSQKGEKIFIKDLLSLKGRGKKKKPVILDDRDEIQDATNSAIVRLLYFSVFARVKQLNPDYEFESKTTLLGTDYFFYQFPSVLNQKDVIFTGVVSEDSFEFNEFLDNILERIEKTDQLIIIGINTEHAKNIADWTKKELKKNSLENAVWYAGYKDENIIDLQTGEEAIFEIESDESEDEELDFDDEDFETEEWDLEEIDEPENEESETTEEIEEIKEAEDIPKIVYDEKETDVIYQQMLCEEKFFAATAYLKAAANENPEYEVVYRQLAYALNDPMENCSYNSDTIFDVYYNSETLVSEYFVIAAAIRNYFLDQFQYDYSLQQLQSTLVRSTVLEKNPVLHNIVYTLQNFKTEYHSGMDRYADYHQAEEASREKRLEEIQREARNYYESYCSGNLKENASHRRFIETRKLLLGQGSDLSNYLTIVIEDDREMMELLEEFLAKHYVRDHAAIHETNLDSAKINAVLDEYWELATQEMNVVKKTSDLMSSLRMNLFKQVSKIAGVLCNYVFLIKSAVVREDEGLSAYKKIRASLLSEIKQSMKLFSSKGKGELLSESAGKKVLLTTLLEVKKCLEGTYKEGANKYFYISFLKNDKVLLGEDYLPVLDSILELPEFSVMKRIEKHCKEPEMDFIKRLQEIFTGGDDYGSAELILAYLKYQNVKPKEYESYLYDMDKAILFPQKDIENKRNEFIEDLELAQSYGQIDNTVENKKETIIQIMDTWYQWAIQSKNYGFFVKIQKAFMEKIKTDALGRAAELQNSLAIYLKENEEWEAEERTKGAVEKIRQRIEEQNYAAAEDLLNRLITGDIDAEIEFAQTDYLEQFLDEYELNYKKTANSGVALKSLLYIPKSNKDTKGAGRLIESWPKGAGVSEANIGNLLNALGFQTESVKAEALIQGRIENYHVTLKRPQNGRKSNYKHPISAFGSEAEEKGFRVVCIFGKTDASRLIDTFKEIGNAKNTIVLLDYALTLADRRTLARKTKTDLSGKCFAVIDRVVIAYLARKYTETAINRMLMAIIMPFASYQPYIDKSADVMPQEIFIGRKNELEKIESPTGVNIVYGGRQLGKTALLRMAKKDIDRDENGDRAIIVSVWKLDYKKAAERVSEVLYDEKFLKVEQITDDWNKLARNIKNRLLDTSDPIPYFLLMLDEADVFIESCEEIGYQPFEALKEIQSIGTGRFKFVIAGLRNIVRFKKTAALGNNSTLTHLESLTIKPFKTMEARELLEVPLSYLGFRFPKDNETEILVSTIFGTTNYFPGLIQLYCTKLIEAMRRDYAGYSESDTPPYIVKKEHIKRVLAEQSLQEDIREKFFITLKVDEDDDYYIIALLVAYHYHENKEQNGCSARDLQELAETFDINKLSMMEENKVLALMEEMRELNVLQHTGDGRYRFARHSFCQMMGTMQQIDDELLKYMGD